MMLQSLVLILIICSPIAGLSVNIMSSSGPHSLWYKSGHYTTNANPLMRIWCNIHTVYSVDLPVARQKTGKKTKKVFISSLSHYFAEILVRGDFPKKDANCQNSSCSQIWDWFTRSAVRAAKKDF